MQRQLLITVAAFFICSCNASDASVGINSSTDKNPDGAATNSIANFTRIDLGTLGGSSSYAADLNGSNVVVGWSQTASGATHAFRWTAAAGMVDLGTLPGHQTSRAVAIIDSQNPGDAQILGVSGDGASWTPVVWDASGSISELPVPLGEGAEFNFPTAFNANGDVVGWGTGTPFQQGWVWSATDGKYDLAAHLPGGTSESSAAAITASGQVVITAHGWECSHNPSCWRTYVWSKAGGYRSLETPGSNREADVTGLGLNESGTVVGWTTVDGGLPAPYRWAATGGFTLLPHYAGGDRGYAAAVNSAGTVVGADFDPVSGSMIASAWSASGSISKLTGDANPSVAVAINNSGTIAGWSAFSGTSNHAVVWKAAGSAGTRSNLTAPTSVSARLSTSSSACLMSKASITSRAALFDCVIKADRKR